MTEPTEEDRGYDGGTAKEMLADSDRSAHVWTEAPLEDVTEGFEQVPYPTERVHYVPGRVEDTVPDQAPDELTLLRLDIRDLAGSVHEDQAVPTRRRLENVYAGSFAASAVTGSPTATSTCPDCTACSIVGTYHRWVRCRRHRR